MGLDLSEELVGGEPTFVLFFYQLLKSEYEGCSE